MIGQVEKENFLYYLVLCFVGRKISVCYHHPGAQRCELNVGKQYCRTEFKNPLIGDARVEIRVLQRRASTQKKSHFFSRLREDQELERYVYSRPLGVPRRPTYTRHEGPKERPVQAGGADMVVAGHIPEICRSGPGSAPLCRILEHNASISYTSPKPLALILSYCQLLPAVVLEVDV